MLRLGSAPQWCRGKLRQTDPVSFWMFWMHGYTQSSSCPLAALLDARTCKSDLRASLLRNLSPAAAAASQCLQPLAAAPQANGANIKGGTWFETGAAMLGGGTLNYFAVPWAVVNNPLPLVVVTAIEVVLLGAVEKYRSDGQGPPGYSPGVGQFDSDIFNGLDNLYPGACWSDAPPSAAMEM